MAGMSVIRTLQEIPQKSSWKLPLISRAHQMAKNYNPLLSLMEAQWVIKILENFNKAG